MNDETVQHRYSKLPTLFKFKHPVYLRSPEGTCCVRNARESRHIAVLIEVHGYVRVSEEEARNACVDNE